MRNSPSSSAPRRFARDEVERIYPLGPMQAGMLFHDLIEPDLSPYYRQVSFTLTGTLDPRLCEMAWNALLARHALMRSVFDYERTAKPLQIVLKRQGVAFEYQDIEGPDTHAEVEAYRQADARRGFDPSRDSLTRVTLFRHGPDHYEMVWSHPHILVDGWSGAILLGEFAILYAAGRHGIEPALPPAPDPDAFMAERAARDGDAALRHWATLLEGYDAIASLPRLPRTNEPPRLVEHRIRISPADTRRLRMLAATHDATLGVLLQAFWGLLLGRWTGREDVVFGTVVSGRGVATPGVERLVGMFVNTIPVRVRWNG